jgi:3-oxoacyl-[acyl-carrier-protein] synthase III
MKKGQARLIGMGTYLPQRILTNQELEKLVDTSDEWIVSRTGIQERRIAAADEFTSDMGAAAAQKALEEAHVSAGQVELILVATMTPDYLSCSTAGLIQAKLGCHSAAAVDLQAACSGFIYGLSMAKAYIESGMYRLVLLIAAEKMSTYINYQDRSTCVLFGDGAAAAVISDAGPGLLIESVSLGADGRLAELGIIPAGGVRHPCSKETLDAHMHYFKMDGKEVFKHAVRQMHACAKACLKQAQLNQEDLAWLVPHQANMRIMSAVAKGFSLPEERMYKTVHKYGNTSASSVAIALAELQDEHQLEEGSHLLLVVFGVGLNWGAALLKKAIGSISCQEKEFEEIEPAEHEIKARAKEPADVS